MRKILILYWLSLFFILNSHSQDTINLYFKKENLLFSEGKKRIEIHSEDSSFYETVFSIGKDKFLYLKRSVDNNLPVELGQLGLYTIKNKLYLLREGVWIVEESKEKVLFEHDRDFMLEEIPVSTEPVYFDSRYHKRKRIKKTSGTSYH